MCFMRGHTCYTHSHILNYDNCMFTVTPALIQTPELIVLDGIERPALIQTQALVRQYTMIIFTFYIHSITSAILYISFNKLIYHHLSNPSAVVELSLGLLSWHKLSWHKPKQQAIKLHIQGSTRYSINWFWHA